MVSMNAGVAGSGWPAPTDNTVYAFFLPPGTNLLGGGGGGNQDTCAAGVGGYHGDVAVGSASVPYAVVPSCNFKILPNAADQTTASMSHELIESATDPQPNGTGAAWIGFNIDPFAFDYFYFDLQLFDAEIGDACEVFDGVFYQDMETSPAPFSAFVQRTWSNKSGLAGHDPCVPESPGETYFNVAPLGMQDVTVSLPAQLTGSSGTTSQPTKGYKIAAGATGTFQVGFYSDGPTNQPWDISAVVGNPIPGATAVNNFNKSSLTASLDKTSGVNGEKAWVTVKVATTGSTFKGEMITIVSSLNSASYYMPIWIAGQ
jgi:hypothetical protein